MQKNMFCCFCTPHAKTQIYVFATPLQKHVFAVCRGGAKKHYPYGGKNTCCIGQARSTGGAVKPRTPLRALMRWAACPPRCRFARERLDRKFEIGKLRKMTKKKRPWNKADKKAAKMPPLHHTANGKFSHGASEVIQWMTAQPEILNWVFDTMRSHGAIEFDAESGVWVGVNHGN